MGIPSPTARAIQIAVALEIGWAVYAAYVTHHYTPLGWRLQLFNFVDNWAHAAVAIVVVTWLADIALAQYRVRGA